MQEIVERKPIEFGRQEKQPLRMIPISEEEANQYDPGDKAVFHPGEFIFGKQTLDELVKIKQEYPFVWESERAYKFKGLREVLKSYAENSEYDDILTHFLQETWENVPEFREISSVRDIETFDMFSNVIMDSDLINDDVFQKMLESHKSAYLERSADLQRKENYKKIRFLRYVEKHLVQESGLNIDIPRIKNRLDKTKILLVDGLGGMTSNPRSLGGKFHNIPLIHIYHHSFEESQERIIYHELMHEIAGREYHQKVEVRSNSKNSPISTRLGVSKMDYLGSTPKRRFNWLNEALTEALLYEMVQQEDPAYVSDLALLDVLLPPQGKLRKELSLLLYNAHFENDQDRPYWEKFVSAMDQMYQPGFLEHLDIFVRKNGSSAAVEIMENDWRGIVEDNSVSNLSVVV